MPWTEAGATLRGTQPSTFLKFWYNGSPAQDWEFLTMTDAVSFQARSGSGETKLGGNQQIGTTVFAKRSL